MNRRERAEAVLDLIMAALKARVLAHVDQGASGVVSVKISIAEGGVRPSVMVGEEMSVRCERE